MYAGETIISLPRRLLDDWLYLCQNMVDFINKNKNMFKKRLIVVLFSLFALALPMFASAATFLADDNVVSSEPVNDNLYVAGGNPVVSGNVNGDLLIAGGNVNVTGDVTGDVSAAGGSVSITGRVGGDIRVFGGNLFIDSTVGGEVVSFGGQIIYGPNAKVAKDIVAGGNAVNISPTAVIGGERIIFDEIKDEIKKGKAEFKEKGADFLRGAFWVGILWTLLSYLIVALAFMGLFPKVVKMFINGACKNGMSFWKSIGMGLVILIVTPILSLILLVTGIGAMLGGIIMMLYMVYIMASLVFAGFIFGTLMKKLIKKGKADLDWLWGLGGVAVLPLVVLVPFVGWIIGFVFFLWALGAAVSADFKMFRSA